MTPSPSQQIIWIVTNAVLVLPTRDILNAGELRSFRGAKWSYVVWREKNALLMTLWKRGDWKKRLRPNGIVEYFVEQGGVCAALSIEPEALASQFDLRLGKWADPKRQQLLQIPYKLKGISGVIVVRRHGDRWHMEPDRGTVDAMGVWQPEP